MKIIFDVIADLFAGVMEVMEVYTNDLYGHNYLYNNYSTDNQELLIEELKQQWVEDATKEQ